MQIDGVQRETYGLWTMKATQPKICPKINSFRYPIDEPYESTALQEKGCTEAYTLTNYKVTVKIYTWFQISHAALKQNH